MSSFTSPLPLLLALSLSACESSPPEPRPQTTQQGSSTKLAAGEKDADAAERAKSPTPKIAPGGDPLEGKFTLDDATQGLSGDGQLTATMTTSLGTLDCKLFDDRAPTTVANFVGLARGLRPFKEGGKWVKRPAYDGTTFHRVIKGFMIQGGDPEGTGKGEPGYVIPDEIWEGAKHDRRGLLCMANRGPNTNGMQFFITDASAPHLDRSYTIFGECGPDAIVEKLASVDTNKTKGTPGRPDRPVDPPKIESIKISRK